MIIVYKNESTYIFYNKTARELMELFQLLLLAFGGGGRKNIIHFSRLTKINGHKEPLVFRNEYKTLNFFG